MNDLPSERVLRLLVVGFAAFWPVVLIGGGALLAALAVLL